MEMCIDISQNVIDKAVCQWKSGQNYCMQKDDKT